MKQTMKTNTQADTPRLEGSEKDYSGLAETPVGMAECFWCGKVKDSQKMRKDTKHGMRVSICEGC